MRGKWTLSTKDIVTLVVICMVLGVTGVYWSYIYFALVNIPTWGGIVGSMITWYFFIPGCLAAYLIRKPGAAFVGSILPSFAGVLFGHPLGLADFGWAIMSAVFCEAVFALYRYKNWGLVPLLLSGELQAFQYLWGVYYFGQFAMGINAWLWPFLAGFLTAWVAGLLAYWIGNAIMRTGLYKFPEPAKPGSP